jgi:hypothetical protein
LIENSEILPSIGNENQTNKKIGEKAKINRDFSLLGTRSAIRNDKRTKESEFEGQCGDLCCNQ